MQGFARPVSGSGKSPDTPTLVIDVIYEDEECVVVNKPAGLLVHDAPGKHKERTLVDWVRDRYPGLPPVGDDPETRPGIVHRLDRETSGVLVIAKTQEKFLYLKTLFQEHHFEKTYYALVAGEVRTGGVITKPIGLKPGTVKRTVFVKNAKMIKPAETTYTVNGYYVLQGRDGKEKQCTLLTVLPRTGRTHQIRVHLASIGHPVMGDAVYGGKPTKAEGGGRHLLHAYSLCFPVKEGEMATFVAELPEDFRKVLARRKTLDSKG